MALLGAGTAVVFGLAAIGAFFLREQRRPIQIARDISGLELPDDARLLFMESSWGSFFPDGHSIVVFELPESIGSALVNDCAKYGFESGGPSGEGVRVPALDAQFARVGALCHKVRWFRYGMDVVVVSRGRVGVYLSRY